MCFLWSLFLNFWFCPNICLRAYWRIVELQAHPWFTDSEREQICRLMNCQKLSLEASTHAAQNERLPLRVIVQVLFFEQLRLRTSISGWFSVSDSLDNYQNPNANLALTAQDRAAAVEDVRERISDLEKECQTMRCEIQKLVKTKRSWNIFCRRKSQNGNSTESKASSLKAPPPALVKEREKSWKRICGKLNFEDEVKVSFRRI